MLRLSADVFREREIPEDPVVSFPSFSFLFSFALAEGPPRGPVPPAAQLRPAGRRTSGGPSPLSARREPHSPFGRLIRTGRTPMSEQRERDGKSVFFSGGGKPGKGVSAVPIHCHIIKVPEDKAAEVFKTFLNG